MEKSNVCKDMYINVFVHKYLEPKWTLFLIGSWALFRATALHKNLSVIGAVLVYTDCQTNFEPKGCAVFWKISPTRHPLTSRINSDQKSVQAMIRYMLCMYCFFNTYDFSSYPFSGEPTTNDCRKCVFPNICKLHYITFSKLFVSVKNLLDSCEQIQFHQPSPPPPPFPWICFLYKHPGRPRSYPYPKHP